MVSLKNKIYRKGKILKKKEKVNKDEIIAKLYANLFINLQNSTLALAEHYDKQSTFLLEKLYELKDNEPQTPGCPDNERGKRLFEKGG